jgi:hypothetical protein
MLCRNGGLRFANPPSALLGLNLVKALFQPPQTLTNAQRNQTQKDKRPLRHNEAHVSWELPLGSAVKIKTYIYDAHGQDQITESDYRGRTAFR